MAGEASVQVKHSHALGCLLRPCAHLTLRMLVCVTERDRETHTQAWEGEVTSLCSSQCLGAFSSSGRHMSSCSSGLVLPLLPHTCPSSEPFLLDDSRLIFFCLRLCVPFLHTYKLCPSPTANLESTYLNIVLTLFLTLKL